MRLFFKFFFMGLRKLFVTIVGIIIFCLPWVLGISIGNLLMNVMSEFLAVFLGIGIVMISYYLIYLIAHSVMATNYYKEYNLESLKEAWDKTSIFNNLD